jgi:purine-nucleoside phosphorylase
MRQPVDFISGSLDGVAVSVLTVGVGPANAERYTRYALEAMHPEIPAGVVSFGTCGSLVDSLQTGDVVTATVLLVEGTDETKQRLQMQPMGNLRQVAMATCRVPVRCALRLHATLLQLPPQAICVVRWPRHSQMQVFDPDRRSALASIGCEVCEMEADGVLRAAVAVLGADLAEDIFGAVKVISDQAGATKDDVYGQGIGKAFDRDAFLAIARDICTNQLGPVLGECLRSWQAHRASARL